VWLHLLHIRRRRAHKTVKGVEFSALARRCLKVKTLAPVWCPLKFLKPRFRARMASRHSSVHHGKGTRCGLVDDLEIDCSEALVTVCMNLSTMECSVGKSVSSIMASCEKRAQSASFTTQYELLSSWRATDCRH
jgi:hypothetical protein